MGKNCFKKKIPGGQHHINLELAFKLRDTGFFTFCSDSPQQKQLKERLVHCDLQFLGIDFLDNKVKKIGT